MWQIYAFRAQELIRDRHLEAARAALARTGFQPVRRDRRPPLVHRAAASALRRLAAIATTVSSRAGTAAGRLDGRTA